MEFNHYVVIDGERYALPGDGALDGVRRELLDAVQSGGAYVSLGRGDIGFDEVLVTAASRVRIEHLAQVETPDVEGDAVDTYDPYWWS